MALSNTLARELEQFSMRPATKELATPILHVFQNNSPPALNVDLSNTDIMASAGRSAKVVATLRADILEHFIY